VKGKPNINAKRDLRIMQANRPSGYCLPIDGCGRDDPAVAASKLEVFGASANIRDLMIGCVGRRFGISRHCRPSNCCPGLNRQGHARHRGRLGSKPVLRLRPTPALYRTAINDLVTPISLSETMCASGNRNCICRLSSSTAL
jgi:hypothetical protein